jgi:hypothetical protein
MVFAGIWVTVVYFPVASWVFNLTSGWAATWGVIDFAGGTAVHINAGAAGLALAIVLGKRVGFAKGAHKPHNPPFVLLGASDLLFHSGWDVEALRVAEQTGAGVIGTNDLANPAVKAGRHSTHPLVRRSYIDEVGGTFDQGPGVVYFEGYDHQCVDNELCIAATKRKQWAFAKESKVQHLHPIFDKTISMDDTYRRGLAKGKEDIALLQSRLKAFKT